MSLGSIFYTAPSTLNALNDAAVTAAWMRDAMKDCSRDIRDVAGGIQNSQRYRSLIFFGPGTWVDTRNPPTWREARKTSSNLLLGLRNQWEQLDRVTVHSQLSLDLPEPVRDEFCRLGGFMRSMRLRMGTLWPWSSSVSRIEAAINQLPSPEILEEARLLSRGADELTSRRTDQLFEGIYRAINTERENVSRSLFHAKLAVAGICTALVIGFSVCAYFLSRPTPSYKNYQKNS